MSRLPVPVLKFRHLFTCQRPWSYFPSNCLKPCSTDHNGILHTSLPWNVPNFCWNQPNTFATKTTQNVIVEIYLNSIIGAGPEKPVWPVAGCQLWTVTPLENGSDPLVCLLVQLCEYLRLYCISSRRSTEKLISLTSLVLSCGFCRTTGGC